MAGIFDYSEVFWHLDLHPEDLTQFSAIVRNRIPSAISRPFDSCKKAADAILEATTRRVLPKIFVSDRVGITPVSGDKSVLHMVQDMSPFTLRFLCSTAAFDDLDAIERWKKSHLIVAAFRKTEKDQLAKKMQDCLQRWDLPVLRQFRDYVLTECADPQTPYFLSDDGCEYLNLYDLHREMVLGTRLGLEQEKTWDITLNQKENPFLCGTTGV